MQTYIHLLILRCKILVGSTQTLELHPVDAGCAIASLNSSVAIQDRGTLSITPLSLFIYAKIFYLQRFTVLHHGAHNGGGQTVRCIGGNIQRYRNFAAICAEQVCNDFLHQPLHITVDAGGVQLGSHVEPGVFGRSGNSGRLRCRRLMQGYSGVNGSIRGKVGRMIRRAILLRDACWSVRK